MAVQQRQHVDAVRCRTFLAGWSAVLCLIFCEFLVGASRFVLRALHQFSPATLWAYKRSVKRNAIQFRVIHFRVLRVCRLNYTKLHFTACPIRKSRLVSHRRGTTGCRGKLRNEDPNKSFRHQIFTVIVTADATGRTLKCLREKKCFTYRLKCHRKTS